MKVISILLILIMVIPTIIAVPVYAENTQNIKVNLQNLYSDNANNIADYTFINPFDSVGLKGIYIGSYYPSSIYLPYVYGNKISYNFLINITNDIIADTFTEFYIYSIFVNEPNQNCLFDGYSPIDNISDNGNIIYHFKGVFTNGVHKISFVTKDNNAQIRISDEILGNTTVNIDNVDYNVPYNLDFKMLITNGGQRDLSLLKFDLKHNQTIEFTFNPINNVNYKYTDWFIPCLSNYFYDYTIVFYNALIPTSVSGKNNHHIFYNSSSSGSNFNQFYLYITNKNNNPISITLYFNTYGSTKINYQLNNENIIKGSIIYYTKPDASHLTDYLWQLVDLSNYNNNTKITYNEYFGYLHSIIDIHGKQTGILAKANEMVFTIRQFFNNNAQSLLGDNSTDIFGYISNIASNIKNKILSVGLMIKNFFKKFVDNIISFLKAIVNTVENFITYIVIPLITLFSIYQVTNIMGKIIYQIKRLNYE